MPENERFEKKGELWVPKEEKGPVLTPEELKARRELVEEAKEKPEKPEELYESLERLGGTRAIERVEKAEQELKEDEEEVKTAEIPEAPISLEVLMEEADTPIEEEDFRRTVEESEEEQQEREEKISVLQEAKEAGLKRLRPAYEGASYLAGLDKLGIWAWRGGRKIAVEGGKRLAAMGLSPALAIEEVGKEVAGRAEAGLGHLGKSAAEAKIKSLEKIPEEERKKWMDLALEDLSKEAERKNKLMVKGMKRLYTKGRILRLIDKLWP